MAAGTAPRRVSPGVWVTRSGRKLTPAGSAYWERQYRSGHADGKGRISRASGPKFEQASPTLKKPSFETFLAASHGDRAATAEVNAYISKNSRRTQARAESEARLDQRALGPVLPAARAASKVVNPVAGEVIKSLSPTEAAKGAVHQARKGNLPMAALEAASILPAGRGVKAAKVLTEAAKAGAAVGPEAKILDAIPAMRQARALLNVQHSEERARRIKESEKAFLEAGGGVPGHHAAMGALKGELPEGRFDDVAGQFTDDEMRHLMNKAQELNHLEGYEKTNLRLAFERLQAGLVPRDFEIALFKKAFQPGRKTEAGAPSLAERISDVINIPRSLMATGDFSYRFRQGLYALALHPKMSLKNTARSMRHETWSQPKFDAMMETFMDDPELVDAADRGLAITHVGHGRHIKGREETFSSTYAETLTGGKASPVRAAGRNFTGNAIRDRVGIYKSLLEEARQSGYPITDKFKDDAVKLANWATGRSDWGHETAEMILNTFLFSPKLFKSRVDLVNPKFWKDLDPFIRKKAAKSVVRLVAAGVGILAIARQYGADVETDPRSSDFGKLRVGKTRFDIWGGSQQIVKTIAQLGTQSVKSPTTGKVRKVPLLYPAGRLVEGKLAPPAGFILDLNRGKDFLGQPITWQNEAKQHFIPLLYADIWDAWHQMGPTVAGVGLPLGAFGVGVQTFPAPEDQADTGEDDVWSGWGSGGGSSSGDDDVWAGWSK